MPIRSLAVAFAAVLLWLPSVGRAGARIAMAPISVHAAGNDSSYLSTGLREMLSARLDQFEGVRVIRLDATDPPGDDLEAAVAAGRSAGADYVVFGSFTRFGEGASLDLSCVSLAETAEGEVGEDARRRVFIHSGQLGDIIPQLDTLAEKIARHTLSSGSLRRESEEEAASETAATGEPPAPAELESLKRRVEALERVVYAPVASGDAASEPAGGSESSGSAVR